MDTSHKTRVEAFLAEYARKWAKDLEMERIYGVPTANSMAFQGVDVFGQVLSSLLSGMYGNGGRGSGHDLSNRKDAAGETKTVCLCQPWKCREKKCKKRSPWTSPKCVHCGSDKRERMNHSRFGISAKSHTKYKDTIKMYYMVAIDYVRDDTVYNVRVWNINCEDNQYFQDYISAQYTDSKSSTVNCLPESYDFYMSGPMRLLTATFNLGEIPTILSVDMTESRENMPVDCLNKTEKDIVVEDIDAGYVSYEIVKQKLVRRNKTLGKTRGVTTRHL